jgi:hypothetical protein
VTIIFTTNVSLIECTNLSPDVKNRLLPRRATVPSLSSLPLEERQRELRVFVTHWCRDNGVVLAPSILERLHEMDLSHGSFRTLRGVLESSRFLALSEFGLQQLPVDSATFNIGVAQEFFDEAMKRGQVSYRKPLEASQAGVPRELACLAAVWISYGCVAKNTYDKIRASRGASPPKFNEKLKGFCRRFASSEQAWAFFRDSDSAEERLRQGDLDGYLDCIGAAPERDIVGKLFQFDLVEERESWINRRTEELHLILFGQEGVSLREDTKRKFKKALDNAL